MQKYREYNIEAASRQEIAQELCKLVDSGKVKINTDLCILIAAYKRGMSVKEWTEMVDKEEAAKNADAKNSGCNNDA